MRRLTCAGCTACPKHSLAHSKHFLYRQISNIPRNKPMPCSLLAAPQTNFPPPRTLDPQIPLKPGTPVRLLTLIGLPGMYSAEQTETCLQT